MSLNKLIFPVICGVFSLTCLIATTISQGINLILIIQTLATISLGFSVVLLEKITKFDFSKSLTPIVCFQILLSNCFGSIIGFYNRFPHWDTFVHATFGIVATAFFISILQSEFQKRWLKYFLIPLLSLGAASLWEIFEFCADTLLGIDTQQVIASQLNGVSPIKDTITDISVTLLGVIAFFIYKFVFSSKNIYTSKKRR